MCVFLLKMLIEVFGEKTGADTKKKQELIRKETAAPTDKAAEDLKRKKCMDFFKLELGPQILTYIYLSIYLSIYI